MTKTTNYADLLAEVFDRARRDLRDELRKQSLDSEYESLKADFVFHMTDWLDDLRRLHSLQETPDVWSGEEAEKFLIGFLYHVVPHLNAAGRLLLDEVPDPFVGAASEAPDSGRPPR